MPATFHRHPALGSARAVAVALGLVLGTVTQGRAEDVLVFPNGDRITGVVVDRTPASIVFRSPVLGEFVVAVSDVRVESSGSTMAASAAEAKVEEDPEAAVEAMANRAQAEREDRPARGSRRSPWSHGVNLGFKTSEARDDRLDLNFRGESIWKVDGSEVRMTARYDYSELESNGSDKRTITDRVQGTVRGRHDLSKRTYLQADSRYASDEIRGLDHEIEQSLGMGWRLIDRAPWRATVTPAATGEWRRETGVTDWSVQATVFQDLRYRFSERLTFFQEADFSVDPLSGGDYQANVDMRIEAKVNSTVAVDLRYELDVDTALRTTVEESQSRILATLGLKF